MGFSNFFVKEDPRGAIYLLKNYQAQLVQFQEIPKGDEYLTPYRRDSFKYLIPFSDSIFFYSENLIDFALCAGSLLFSDSFSFTSDAFSNPEDPKHPENITERSVEHENGKVITKNHSAKWYPLLFRGGISFGDSKPYEL